MRASVLIEQGDGKIAAPSIGREARTIAAIAS
jgi:hypothetical protein